MAAQLGRRPSRVERPSLDEKMDDAKSYRVVASNAIKNPAKVLGNVTKKPMTLNFICMCAVASVFDIIGLFLNEVPGVGIAIQIIADTTFIPWFYFSGIKFNGKRIGSMASTSILESIPFVGNLPFILLNVIYSYYSK